MSDYVERCRVMCCKFLEWYIGWVICNNIAEHCIKNLTSPFRICFFKMVSTSKSSMSVDVCQCLFFFDFFIDIFCDFLCAGLILVLACLTQTNVREMITWRQYHMLVMKRQWRHTVLVMTTRWRYLHVNFFFYISLS